MFGLIQKDFYAALRYCKSFIIMIMIIAALNIVGTSTSALGLMYPCMLASMIPVTLLGIDEKTGWLAYSQTMPYSKEEAVVSKYLFGAFTQMISYFVIEVSNLARHLMSGLDIQSYLENLHVTLRLSIILFCLISATTLPFMFKYGVEKGRMINMVAIGAICAIVGILMGTGDPGNNLMQKIYLSGNGDNSWLLSVAAILTIVVYLLSMYISIILYKKREVR